MLLLFKDAIASLLVRNIKYITRWEDRQQMLTCDWVRINVTKQNPISELWLHWSQGALRWLSSTAGHWECCWRQLRAFNVESSCLTHTAGVWGQVNALDNDIRNFYTSGPYSYGVSWAPTHLLFVAESRGCQRKGGGFKRVRTLL